MRARPQPSYRGGKQVLPLFRSRADLHRWDAVDRYCRQARHGVSLLDEAVENEGPAAVLAVAQKALASVGRVMLHADDSNGSIGGLFDRLLELHARMCAQAPPVHGRLVTWMIRFQFGNGQDFVLLDPADYASALGAKGLAKYETELAKVSATVQLETGASENQAAGPLQPDGTAAWQRRGEHTHAGDQTRSCKLQHTATALAEIGETGLAIDWAHRGALLESGHQAEAAAGASCCTSNGPGTRQAHV